MESNQTKGQQRLAQRVEKYEAAVAEESKRIAELTEDARHYMSPRNPNARRAYQQRDQAQSRLYTAKRRLTAAAEALAASWTLEACSEYVMHGDEAEGEQRAEYGSGAASMGYDPVEWASAYEGYRTADDATYAACERRLAANAAVVAGPAPVGFTARNTDDIPF